MVVSHVDHAGELAEIAGPIVSLEDRHVPGREAAACRAGALVGPFQKRLGQKQQVVPALAQGKSPDHEDAQSVIELRPDLLLPERGLGIADGGRDQPHPAVERLGEPRLQVTRQGQDVSDQQTRALGQ